MTGSRPSPLALDRAINDSQGAVEALHVEQLQALSDRFESATPQEIVRWAIEAYRGKLTVATAFGAEGYCLIAMIAQVRDETGIVPDIFNLDTGYQFPETLELQERLQKHYGLCIRRVGAPETVEHMEARFGGPIYGTDPDHCCYLRKVVPLQTALQGFDAWMAAIRREQTPERAPASIVGPDSTYCHLVKINLLANWTKTQVWDYIHKHRVPVNPLHAQGYQSIGCWRCIQAVVAGEDDRAGRWAGMAKRECGLHVKDCSRQKMTSAHS
ncbi:MAG TPA: phosphoadenylyl-sulfate reductase [Candidatus Tectomicrobia bacterium]